MEIFEATVGPGHPLVATGLIGLARLYFDQGQYSQAEPLFQQALKIDEAALGPDHRRIASNLTNLGELYHRQGQYAQAEPLYQRALQISESALGPNHPDVAASLKGLADLYTDQGQYAQAEPLYQRALQIMKTAKRPDHPDVAIILRHLGMLFQTQDQYAQAEPLYQRSLEIQEATLGPDHPDVANSLTHLAILYYRQGQYAQAEPLYQRALQIQEAALGPDHPDVAANLNNLAEQYRAKGQYAQAQPLYQRALQISEGAMGPAHPSVAIILHNLAALYGATKQYPEALEFFQRGLTIETDLMHEVFAIRQEESEKYGFVKIKQAAYFQVLSLIHRFLSQESEALALGVNLILARKGLILDIQTRYQEVLARGLAPQLQSTWQQLQVKKASHAKLLRHPPSTLPLALYRDRLATLQGEIANLEAKLGSQSGMVADLVWSQQATLIDVATRLPSDAVLLEMVKIPNWKWETGRWAETWQYIAFILHPNQQTDFVDLGRASAVEPKLREALASIRQEPWLTTLSEQLRAAKRLYDIVWKPLRPAIGAARTVILSPDGLLNLVPFGAIYTPESRFVVEDKTVITVSSGRDLVKAAGRMSPEMDLFLAADPAFGLPGAGPRREKLQGRVTATHSVTMEQSFARLKGTMREAKDIPPLVPGEQKVVVLREQATEGAVLEANRPRVLHLATHGFFLEDLPPVLPEKPTLEGSKALQSIIDYENPLTRSGLAFAGANAASRTTEERDGLLTALEVSGMDLHGTELVVLSACDTGIGTLRNGEGVYGLRRAFALAGVQNLVMSLWPVWDKQAMKQMRTFYAKYGEGLGMAQALREAQLERIKWFRKYTNGEAPPSVWAPFLIQINATLQE